QHAPQYFWKPEYQQHPNGAVAVVEAMMVADDPPALAGFFAGLQGQTAAATRDGRLEVTTARGRVTMLGPDAAAERFPGLPLKDAPASPHFVGYRVAVRDLEALRMRFDASDVRYRPMAGAVQIAPDVGYGSFIEFSAA
ncbi:MAG: hypothetical protein HY246_22390, partial [Proteobacteria bacterium]|nr:hypothetical protein [Pseudomonadota bacterium]